MARSEAVVLASTSPQRRTILEQLRIPFEVVAPSYEEESGGGGSPLELVGRHASGKARSVAARMPDRIVLGVDTAVVLDGVVHGKPADADAAAAMLRALSARVHEVVSALCLIGPGIDVVEHDVTKVTFRALCDADVQAYVASGEWQGRAGAYAIQGLGASLVERIEGDYLNVVGLPASLLVRLLGEHRAVAHPGD